MVKSDKFNFLKVKMLLKPIQHATLDFFNHCPYQNPKIIKSLKPVRQPLQFLC